MHTRSSQNTSSIHPNPSLLSRGYTFFPPGSDTHTSNMRDVAFGPNTSIISGPWGSYIRMDICPSGSTANMDGSDAVDDDRQDGRDPTTGEMEDAACSNDANNTPEAVLNSGFPAELDIGGHHRYIPTSPAARLHIHHANANSSTHRLRMHDQRNDRSLPTLSFTSHTHSNIPPTFSMFRGARNVQISGGATFSTVDGNIVESRTYGTGPINNFEFGARSIPGQPLTPHQQPSRFSGYDSTSYHLHRRTMGNTISITSTVRYRGDEYSEVPIEDLPPYTMGPTGGDRTLETDTNVRVVGGGSSGNGNIRFSGIRTVVNEPPAYCASRDVEEQMDVIRD